MTTIEFKGTGTEILTQSIVNSKITSDSPNDLTVEITGYTEIGSYAFDGKTKITKVVITDVQNVKLYAFQNCTSLQNVKITRSTFYNYAFQGCTSLQKVEILEDFTGDNYSFSSSGLKNVSIKNTETSISKIQLSFDENTGETSIEKTKIDVNAGTDKNFFGATGVTIEISDQIPFEGNGTEILTQSIVNSKITSDSPNGLTVIITGYKEIGEEAFSDLSINRKIEEVSFKGVSLTTIGKYAFANCVKLKKISIPSSVTTIDEGAFTGCIIADPITILAKVTTISKNAFYGCEGLENIAIPDTVETIQGYAFYNCKNLKSVKIPGSVTNIQNTAFLNCTKINFQIEETAATNLGITKNEWQSLFGATIVTIYIVEDTKDYGSNSDPNTITFEGTGTGNETLTKDTVNSKITSDSPNDLTVTIRGYTSIEDRAFYQISKIKSLTIGTSVKTIGKEAFMQQSGNRTLLETLTFEEESTLETIGQGAFMYASLLKTVVLPDSVKTLGTYNASNTIDGDVFQYCEKLSSVTIGKGIEIIPNRTFFATDLREITIPANVTTINNQAFGEKLQKITFAEVSKLQTIKSYAFTSLK